MMHGYDTCIGYNTYPIRQYIYFENFHHTSTTVDVSDQFINQLFW